MTLALLFSNISEIIVQITRPPYFSRRTQAEMKFFKKRLTVQLWSSSRVVDICIQQVPFSTSKLDHHKNQTVKILV